MAGCGDVSDLLLAVNELGLIISCLHPSTQQRAWYRADAQSGLRVDQTDGWLIEWMIALHIKPL